ncbi:hypothetical protein [uncultured Methylobacterium sp.]|uniref:hypothetical protein n=1 Tax=uncultured Methylobacterium sp. TaxID=157278 RepID=UPI0035CA034B
MAPGTTRMSGLRAITAVIALYALVLQAFLGGLMPVAVGQGGEVLCLSGTDVQAGNPAPDRSAPHGHADCCTAAHVAAAAVAPRASPAIAAWPMRRSAIVTFAADAANGPRAPPGSIAHPRGPPVV